MTYGCLVEIALGKRGVDVDVEEIYGGVVGAGFADDDFHDIAIIGGKGYFQGGNHAAGGGVFGYQFKGWRILTESGQGILFFEKTEIGGGPGGYLGGKMLKPGFIGKFEWLRGAPVFMPAATPVTANQNSGFHRLR